MIIRARAPLRISFGGGGTDVPPYCDERGGAVLSAAINRYACASIETGKNEFSIRSLDYDITVRCGLEDSFIFDGQLDLAKVVLTFFRKEYGLNGGLDVYLHNDAPPGSGLGSSSAITVALISALADLNKLPMDSYQIAELAYQLERKDAGILGGKQDQYAAAFGGFNFIEFENGTTVVNSLRLKPETIFELEYSLIFAYIGGQHVSSHIIEKQVNNYRTGKMDSIEAMDRLKQLAYDMKNALLTGKLMLFGELLDEAWKYKKKMADGISNAYIDEIYEEAKKAGAIGGKVSGAGGGGFMFFMCDPRCRFAVQECIARQGGEVVNLSFEKNGVRSWRLE